MKPIRLLSIQVGSPQTFARRQTDGLIEKPWTTSFSKHPVTGPVWVGEINIDGDRQTSRTHGGPEKAVCLYPSEHYSYWQRELNLMGAEYGAYGENFTTRGLLEDRVCIGDTIAFGEAVVQVSQPRPPCWRLSQWWRIKDFDTRMEQTGRTGWYLRVIKEGYVEAGARVELLESNYPEWSVAVANDLMYGRRDNEEEMRALADCHLLSEGWREELMKKVARRRETI